MIFGLEFRLLEIENFKAYAGVHRLTFDRQPGLYYVTGINHVEPGLGANGAAKTTLWEAIYWCLYGVPLRASRSTAIEPWFNTKKIRVAVEFLKNGKKYKVVRTRRPNSLTLADRFDTKEVEQRDIDKLIGLTKLAFLCTVILPQYGELFLDLTPEGQSSLFTETLDLDLWVKASEMSSKMVTAIQGDLTEAVKKRDMCQAKITEVLEECARTEGRREAWVIVHEDDSQQAYKEVEEIRHAIETLVPARDSERGSESSPVPSEADLAAIEGAIQRLRQETNELARAAGELEAEERGLRRVVRDCEEKIKKMRSAGAICPECGQMVTMDHYAGKIESLISSQDTAEVERSKKVTGLTANNTRRAELHDTTELRQNALRDGRLRRQQYVLELAKVDPKQQLLHRLEQAEDRVASLRGLENPHKATLVALTERLNSLEDQKAGLSTDVNVLKEEYDLNNYWVGGFKEIRLSQIDDVLTELQVVANQNAESLGLTGWRITFATERETTTGMISRKFNSLIYPPGVDVPIIFEAYSGGESQRWQLAVTFGLSELLLSRAGVNPNIEVLDEPTQHMTDSGVDDLLIHLRERARRTNRQIYLVDHRALNLGSFDGVLMVEKRQDGSSFKFL